jgi:hypothetical protein
VWHKHIINSAATSVTGHKYILVYRLLSTVLTHNYWSSLLSG